MISALRALRAALPLLAVVAVLVLLALVDRRTSERDAARAETVTLRADMRVAREDARRADLANVTRVRADQDAITKEVVADYEMELSAVRARVERLRRDAAPRAGGGGSAPVPRSGSAPGGADPAAGEGGLPPLSDADALIATEQALQLAALIDWVEQQAAVEPSR
ncbi:hypothetical protein [Sphingomonas sp. VNH70]|uniref:hypothetical protein n=1 Tax=Sphingomonas silueang TaxID=3156617 RepID=UPI0032B371B4